MQITTIGLDIAKNVFQVHGIDAAEKVVVRKQLRRSQVLEFFKALPPCLVGMEACATAHYWARELTKLGHQVRLMPAKDVKAYVKRNKNDAADAEAICEAVRRPTMRFVQVKSAEQQSQLMLHRARDLLMRQRTQVINALRAHMAELGMTAAQGNAGLRELLAIIAGAADERNLILPSPVPLGRRHQRTRPIGAALDQQCPGDAGHLVGKCYRHNLERFAGEKLREPGILLRLLSYVRSRTAGVMTTLMRNGRDRRSENPSGPTRYT
jgi:transposase